MKIKLGDTIGESHLERLGTRREIALAKAELLDYSSKDGVAILPADSDFYELLCEHALGKRVSFAVSSAEADWHLLATEEKIRLGEHSKDSAMRRLIWRFIFVRLTVSLSIKSKLPIPPLAKASTAYPPTPPIPNTATFERLSFSIPSLPKISSERENWFMLFS